MKEKKKLSFGKITVGFGLVQLICVLDSMAQDGASGINQATSQVRSYFDAGCNLMYAIGAVLGLIGAVKVFSKWNSGEPDTNKVAAAWFGSCVFLVIVATVLKSFFGI
jgi:hypothetical protein